ncbi:hypothetical protein DIPPA_15340, partial [Diplonema papillatum]
CDLDLVSDLGRFLTLSGSASDCRFGEGDVVFWGSPVRAWSCARKACTSVPSSSIFRHMSAIWARSSDTSLSSFALTSSGRCASCSAGCGWCFPAFPPFFPFLPPFPAFGGGASDVCGMSAPGFPGGPLCCPVSAGAAWV